MAIALASIAVLGLGSCGGAVRRQKYRSSIGVSAKASTTPPRMASSRLDQDEDGDSRAYRGHDSDDGKFLLYGMSAGSRDRQAMITVVQSYFAAAARGTGGMACSLMYSTYAEAVVEEQVGPASTSGGGDAECASVLTAIFRKNHVLFSADNATLVLTGARVKGNRGFVTMQIRGQHDRHMEMHREDNAWKVAALFDGGLA
jgi:hypothetical protein